MESIRLLVKKGADVNVRMLINMHTPLHLAVEQGHANIVGYLLQHGARQDIRAEQGLTPIFLAAHLGRTDCLRVLLKNAKDEGRSAGFLWFCDLFRLFTCDVLNFFSSSQLYL